MAKVICPICKKPFEIKFLGNSFMDLYHVRPWCQKCRDEYLYRKRA